ncbi:hypothetical protein SAMN05216289_13413 [Dokdonella immobilis]|uniref:Uncharacterized protein n=1 Tax=Dokdonella immobilis TaxID=578942 RepID=A0A1I5A9L1_9GAMM|nr:hypothetical protein SAMN05216289_13413 [Dokdonella immobilis]
MRRRTDCRPVDGSFTSGQAELNERANRFGPASRQRIVLFAKGLLRERDHQSTTIAFLLKRGDMLRGSLLHFLSGKQDVLLAVLDLHHRGVDRILLAPAWNDVADPIERVFALRARVRDLILQTECGYSCPIGSLAQHGPTRRNVRHRRRIPPPG